MCCLHALHDTGVAQAAQSTMYCAADPPCADVEYAQEDHPIVLQRLPNDAMFGWDALDVAPAAAVAWGWAQRRAPAAATLLSIPQRRHAPSMSAGSSGGCRQWAPRQLGTCQLAAAPILRRQLYPWVGRRRPRLLWARPPQAATAARYAATPAL